MAYVVEEIIAGQNSILWFKDYIPSNALPALAAYGTAWTGYTDIGGFPVQQFITTDGYKFLLPNYEWVAFRASGTEPVIRAYIEAKSPQQLKKKLESACRKILAEV